MTTLKQIEHILSPPPAHMVGDGFRVHNFFPSNGSIDLQRLSPFFLMDYGAKFYFSPTDKPRGVGVHPHRGFETVTIAYQGKIAHHDSVGNAGVIGEGDVQWMTAGSGVLHKEYHEKAWSKKGGVLQMVQLWVNLAAKDKMTVPNYQAIKQQDMGKHILANNQGKVEVIAGSYESAVGPASTFTPIQMYNLRLKTNANISLYLPENHNTAFLVIEGNIAINNSEVLENHLVIFENKNTEIQISCSEPCIVLVISGEPINEPIYPYGPFVMNNKQEIIQAYQDLKDGKFGHLED